MHSKAFHWKGHRLDDRYGRATRSKTVETVWEAIALKDWAQAVSVWLEQKDQSATCSMMACDIRLLQN